MARKSKLVAFFEGTEGDFQGRKFSDILEWPDPLLEASHDYIQTLFPLPEVSEFSWSATIIDREVFKAFRSQPELRAKLRAGFTRMLSFYGFKEQEPQGKTNIVLGDNFESASRHWVCRFDHNHLRITRIIRSLRVLGLEEEALAFFAVLESVQQASNISPRSLMYWSRAAFRPLHIAPSVDEGDEGVVQGPKFLREFEKNRREQAKVGKDNTEWTAELMPEISQT